MELTNFIVPKRKGGPSSSAWLPEGYISRDKDSVCWKVVYVYDNEENLITAWERLDESEWKFVPSKFVNKKYLPRKTNTQIGKFIESNIYEYYDPTL